MAAARSTLAPSKWLGDVVVGWVGRNALILVACLFVIAGAWLAVRLLHPLLSISPTNKDSVPALAAAVAVSGVLITATVTLTGIILKQSIDLRTARAAERDQGRLRMETALQTVSLLGAEDITGQVIRTSAALIVLARLDQVRLAVDLAAELWPKGRVSSSAAAQLVESGLAAPDLDTQHAAAMLLRNNVDRLYATETGKTSQYEWPRALDAWPVGLHRDVRLVIALALRDRMEMRPPRTGDWRLDLLAQARLVEVDDTVKQVLAAPH
jgi:hypothetical protein